MKNIETIGYRNVVVTKEDLGRTSGVHIAVGDKDFAIFDEAGALALVDAILDIVQDVPTIDPVALDKNIAALEGIVADLSSDVDRLIERVRKLEQAAAKPVETPVRWEKQTEYPEGTLFEGTNGRLYRLTHRGVADAANGWPCNPERCIYVGEQYDDHFTREYATK